MNIRPVNGLHHITAIAGPAQENLDFYAGVLGMRLVKKSVNQDDPGTYHLFYADAEGHPGSDLTFFPWAQMAPPRPGTRAGDGGRTRGPAGQSAYWAAALGRYGARLDPCTRASARQVLRSPIRTDSGRARRKATSSPRGRSRPGRAVPLPPSTRSAACTAAALGARRSGDQVRFLTTVLGFERARQRARLDPLRFPGRRGVVDVRDAPEARRGAWGVGCVHHLAWRVDDEAHQLAVRARVENAGTGATPVIDRFWFQSVYFREPGGVLFELATDGPGFAVDEDAAHLGETLVLPPWLEASRTRIEEVLPPLRTPHRD